MVANKLFKKSVFILLFIVSAAFTFAQKVGDRNYKLVSIDGEKVYRWMECLDVVEYYENGTIRSYNKKYNYDTFSDHLGQRNWAVTNPDNCCIDYIKTTKLDYTDGAGNPIINTTVKRFSNGKLVYERSLGGDGFYTSFYEYNVNGKAITIDSEGNGFSYYNEYDAKGNRIYTNDFYYGDFYGSAWFEYDKEGKPFRYFTEKNGWENLTEELLSYLDYGGKLSLKELKKESIPDSYWKGNITYWINYTSPTSYQGSNGMQFEITPKGQVVSYKTKYEQLSMREYSELKHSGRDSEYKLTEQYEYDSEGRESVYKYSDFSDHVFCEEHYDYNKKGNKVRYTATFFDWEWEEKRFVEKNVEKGTFNAKGNKSHFTDTEGNEGYYFYEYYPSGAVKTRRKYKYLTFEEKEY